MGIEDTHEFEDLQNVMELATKNVVTINQKAKVMDILRSVVDHNFRRVPIIEGETGKIQGIISATDLVSFLGEGPNTGL